MKERREGEQCDKEGEEASLSPSTKVPRPQAYLEGVLGACFTCLKKQILFTSLFIVGNHIELQETARPTK